MRIAELSTRYPPGPGGVERHVQELARRFAARGEAVGVFTSDLYREFPWQRLGATIPRSESVGGIAVRRLPVWSLPSELHYPFFRGLGPALREFRPDVLHVHTYGTHQATIARRFHRRYGTPYVLTAHFHPIWSIHGGWLRRRLRSFYDRRLAGPVVAEAARVIVQTREEERLMRLLAIPLPPVEIIPPGYAPLASGPGDPSFSVRFQIPGRFLLFVGRLASNKGLLELVEAFTPLARADPTLTLALVGEDGGMRAEVEANVRALGLAGQVRLTGYITDERLLASAFREAEIFVLPSEYEAFGLVLLEALAQGTAVVASRVGGIPEVLDDGRAGRLVPPKDVAALTAALSELLEDAPARERIGEYGRTSVVPRYDWEHVADRLLALFRGLGGR